MLVLSKHGSNVNHGAEIRSKLRKTVTTLTQPSGGHYLITLENHRRSVNVMCAMTRSSSASALLSIVYRLYTVSSYSEPPMKGCHQLLSSKFLTSSELLEMKTTWIFVIRIFLRNARVNSQQLLYLPSLLHSITNVECDPSMLVLVALHEVRSNEWLIGLRTSRFEMTKNGSVNWCRRNKYNCQLFVEKLPFSSLLRQGMNISQRPHL